MFHCLVKYFHFFERIRLVNYLKPDYAEYAERSLSTNSVRAILRTFEHRESVDQKIHTSSRDDPDERCDLRVKTRVLSDKCRGGEIVKKSAERAGCNEPEELLEDRAVSSIGEGEPAIQKEIEKHGDCNGGADSRVYPSAERDEQGKHGKIDNGAKPADDQELRKMGPCPILVNEQAPNMLYIAGLLGKGKFALAEFPLREMDGDFLDSFALALDDELKADFVADRVEAISGCYIGRTTKREKPAHRVADIGKGHRQQGCYPAI